MEKYTRRILRPNENKTGVFEPSWMGNPFIRTALGVFWGRFVSNMLFLRWDKSLRFAQMSGDFLHKISILRCKWWKIIFVIIKYTMIYTLLLNFSSHYPVNASKHNPEVSEHFNYVLPLIKATDQLAISLRCGAEFCYQTFFFNSVGCFKSNYFEKK